MLSDPKLKRTDVEQELHDDLFLLVASLEKIASDALVGNVLHHDDADDLIWGRERVHDGVRDLVFILEMFERDAGNGGAASHIVLHLRKAILGAFIIGSRGTRSKSAKNLIERERVKPANLGKINAKHERAEGLRDLIERWPRKDDLNRSLKKPGTLLLEAKKRQGYEKLDHKTLKGYIAHIDGVGNNNDPPI